MKLWHRIRPQLGLIILIVAFGMALLRVLTLQSRETVTHKQVIKIVHWQLEAGIREAIDEIGREYSKQHPNVEVQQILIGERGYGSWITTRLIGGTAPELIEMGMVDGTLMNQLWLRYCRPLSDEIVKPNPYNKGTSLEGVPWKDTYYDGMQGGFVDNLLEYYQVPASGFTVRLFYNKPLFKAATGLDKPPDNFREFIAACERIKAYGREHHRNLVPIASAGKYNATFLFERFDQAVNSTLLPEVDANLDGEIGAEECAVALVGGKVDSHDPRIKAMIKGRSYYIPEFQPGFFPADRMDAAFLFIQQKALMIASGSWDAGSYMKQADFEIGVCNFPMPSKEDPKFGRFVEGPAAEEMRGGFAFSINRCAPNAEVALDFMKFMSSQQMNGLLNRRNKWIPMIRGNQPDPFIAPFWPNLDGVKMGIRLDVGPRNLITWNELLSLYSMGKISCDQLLQRYFSTFVANADLFMEMDLPRDSQLAAGQDEFRKASARASEWLTGSGREKATAILEAQVAHRFNDTEMSERYAAARARTKLPTQ